MNLQRGSTLRRLLAIGIVLGILAFRWWNDGSDANTGPAPSASPTDIGGSASQSEGVETILRAFDQGRSGVWVEAQGTIDRHLADDNHGDRHQRFIVRLTSDHTVLISHNIDLADRTAAKVGDTIAFRGRYEWNERGGVVHWTHHDPDRGVDDYSRGGWLRADNVTVR